MHRVYKAVIFDMDGVLVNSEPLWRRAMIKGFTGNGIEFTEEDCRKTTGNRINEVVEYWHGHHRLDKITPAEIERNIIEELLLLIEQEGQPITGIPELLDYCAGKQLMTGLATSSSNELMQSVLKKLNFENHFHSIVSAEKLPYGKPHPEVFLMCAGQLGIRPRQCMVIEDSLNGIIAAKAAQMSVIAVPDEEHKDRKGFEIADHLCSNMSQALGILSGLL